MTAIHHSTPPLTAFVELGTAGALGSFAGWIAHTAQRRWMHP
jgi:hypothetical protein